MPKTQYFLIGCSFHLQSLFQQVTTQLIYPILIATNLKSLIHQTVVEFSLFVIHTSLSSRGINIVLEIVVGMEVDVKVKDDVSEEVFHLFDSGNV